jgi:hypothetical protein
MAEYTTARRYSKISTPKSKKIIKQITESVIEEPVVKSDWQKFVDWFILFIKQIWQKVISWFKL